MPGGILGEEKSGCSTHSFAMAAAASAASSLGDPPMVSLRAAARVTTEPCTLEESEPPRTAPPATLDLVTLTGSVRGLGCFPSLLAIMGG